MKNKLTEAMDCKEVTALLRQYLFDELGAEEHGRVQGHLLECEACSQAFFDQVDGALRMGELPQVSIPAPPVPGAQTDPGANVVATGSKPRMPAMFRGLAGAAREIASKSLAFSRSKGAGVVSLDGGEFTVTLSELENAQQTLVRVAIKPDFAAQHDGKRFVIRDAENVILLSGRVRDGQVSATAELEFASLQSPLLVKIFA